MNGLLQWGEGKGKRLGKRRGGGELPTRGTNWREKLAHEREISSSAPAAAAAVEARGRAQLEWRVVGTRRVPTVHLLLSRFVAMGSAQAYSGNSSARQSSEVRDT